MQISCLGIMIIRSTNELSSVSAGKTSQQRKPEPAAVTFTWHASKYETHKLHQRYTSMQNLLLVYLLYLRLIKHTDALINIMSFSARSTAFNRCSCNCQRVSQNQTVPTPPQPLELLVVRNATSSYRRKKTSILMMQTSHTVIGTTWVLVCSSVVMFVLCDVARLVKWWDRRGDSQRV